MKFKTVPLINLSIIKGDRPAKKRGLTRQHSFYFPNHGSIDEDINRIKNVSLIGVNR